MTQAVTDPFSAPASGGAKYPKLEIRDDDNQIVKDPNCLHGRLLMITPLKVETVPNRLSQVPGATQERVTADVVVLDDQTVYGPSSVIGPPEGELEQVPAAFDGMYFSQAALVSQMRKATKANMAGADPKRMVLGRLKKEPPKEKGRYPTWVLADPTEADKQLARNYLATKNPFE